MNPNMAPLKRCIFLITLLPLAFNTSSSATTSVPTDKSIFNDSFSKTPITSSSNHDSTPRILQSTDFDFWALFNTTCPEECPLCQCDFTNSTCLLNNAIESCASKNFNSCLSFFISIVPGMDPNYDISGLCQSKCNDEAFLQTNPNFRGVCDLCGIYVCCDTCPADVAKDCFPPTLEEGYTPAGWEPATCSSANQVGGSILMLALVVFGAFL